QHRRPASRAVLLSAHAGRIESERCTPCPAGNRPGGQRLQAKAWSRGDGRTGSRECCVRGGSLKILSDEPHGQRGTMSGHGWDSPTSKSAKQPLRKRLTRVRGQPLAAAGSRRRRSSRLIHDVKDRGQKGRALNIGTYHEHVKTPPRMAQQGTARSEARR